MGESESESVAKPFNQFFKNFFPKINRERPGSEQNKSISLSVVYGFCVISFVFNSKFKLLQPIGRDRCAFTQPNFSECTKNFG